MAYLDKDAYFGKQMYAERKMAENAEIDTLTEEQQIARGEFELTDEIVFQSDICFAKCGGGLKWRI